VLDVAEATATIAEEEEEEEGGGGGEGNYPAVVLRREIAYYITTMCVHIK